MAHSHTFTNLTGVITDLKTRVFGGPFSSLKFNGETYYFVPECGIEELNTVGNTEIFTFELFTQLSLSKTADRHKFCTPPLPLGENNTFTIFHYGKYGCGWVPYINRKTNTIFTLKYESDFLIPLVFYNDEEGKMDIGIMYYFHDVEILDEWNARLREFLQFEPTNYLGLQAAIEVRPIRVSMHPFDYSPFVVPVFAKSTNEK